MLETIIICATLIIITLLIRNTVLTIYNPAVQTPEEHQIGYDSEAYLEVSTSSIPDIPEVPDKEWAGTPDNPYTPELGSEQLHELHAEMDLRIADLMKELEYEQKQKAYVEEASKGIVFSEDAEVLAKQLAQKTKIEVAE